MTYLFIVFIYTIIDSVMGQGEGLQVTFDSTNQDGSVNPYFLLLLFWIVAFTWPVIRWVYSTFIERAVNQVKERVESIAHQLSERISAAGRKMSEQVKS